MSKDEFFEQFRTLHAMDGKAPLSKSERADYDRVKERFAAAICAAQKLTVKPGQTARATFRVAMLLRLRVTLNGLDQQTSTLEVSVGGFSAALAKPLPAVGAELGYEIFLSKNESIAGRAKVTDVKPNGRVFATFLDLPPKPTERLERVLFDEMLNQLVKAAVRPG